MRLDGTVNSVSFVHSGTWWLVVTATAPPFRRQREAWGQRDVQIGGRGQTGGYLHPCTRLCHACECPKAKDGRTFQELQSLRRGEPAEEDAWCLVRRAGRPGMVILARLGHGCAFHSLLWHPPRWFVPVYLTPGEPLISHTSNWTQTTKHCFKNLVIVGHW